jgi:2-dehydro-3-deoxyphosphogluconate aldolase/(4S)-4-hydroxy-2-oxoglutarate aldolase
MSRNDDLQQVLAAGVVAILRFDRSEPLIDVAEALLAGGVQAIEITFTVPNAPKVLEQVANKLGDRILLGAGTVLDTETARIALLAGARYLVTPTLRREVIEMCHRYDRLVMPGALTPTEVLTAWEWGADVVKLFPSEITGPRYLKALRGPLPQVRLMPTGGVSAENVGEYIRAGACAVGVGGTLVDPKLVAAGDFSQISARAKNLLEAVRVAREA